MSRSLPGLLPVSTSILTPVESAFVNPRGSQYTVAYGLGAVSRASQCVTRHGSSGLCFGSFEDSRFVNVADHTVGCYGDSNVLTSEQYGSVAYPTTRAYQYAQPQVVASVAAAAAGPPRPQIKSFGSYSSCPNCPIQSSWSATPKDTRAVTSMRCGF